MSIYSTMPREQSRRRIATSVLSIGLLGNLLFGGAAAARAAAPAVRATAPAGGAIRIFVNPGNGPSGTIVIAGAIGDSGTTLTIDQNGKTDENGNFEKITLKKGTFEVNATVLNAASNGVRPIFNATTCSAYFSVTDPVTLLKGTGLYKGISGTLTITESFAFVLPTITSGAKKGQCDQSNNAQPIAQYGVIIGNGTVKFS
jgi:hypothetical protein